MEHSVNTRREEPGQFLGCEPSVPPTLRLKEEAVGSHVGIWCVWGGGQEKGREQKGQMKLLGRCRWLCRAHRL